MIDKETNMAYFFVWKDRHRYLLSNRCGETSCIWLDFGCEMKTMPQTRRDFYKYLKANTTFHETENRKQLITTENIWGMPKFRTWREIPGYLTWNE